MSGGGGGGGVIYISDGKGRGTFWAYELLGVRNFLVVFYCLGEGGVKHFRMNFSNGFYAINILLGGGGLRTWSLDGFGVSF